MMTAKKQPTSRERSPASQSLRDKFKSDFDRLQQDGPIIQLAFGYMHRKEAFEKAIADGIKNAKDESTKSAAKKQGANIRNTAADFSDAYQSWYSESLRVIQQLLPDRAEDFKRQYERPRANRKDISADNYVIEDALSGLTISMGSSVKASPATAQSKLDNQVSILSSIGRCFESSLFDIKTMVQADLLDSELDAARELLKHKFVRGAGAIAGVVLESHLAEVCTKHGCLPRKKNLAISDLNDALKDTGTTELATWRFIQHLADLRNKCDHNKETPPTPDDGADLINGVDKIIKTIF